MADYEAQGNFVERQREKRDEASSDDNYGSDYDIDYSDDGGDSNDMGSMDDVDDMDMDGVDDEDAEDLLSENGGMPDDSIQLTRDKEWLDKFIREPMKSSITKVELEIDNIRNKKIRGTTKKQKDMLKALNDKLKLMRATKEKCEELAMTMEFLAGGAIQ